MGLSHKTPQIMVSYRNITIFSNGPKLAPQPLDMTFDQLPKLYPLVKSTATAARLSPSPQASSSSTTNFNTCNVWLVSCSAVSKTQMARPLPPLIPPFRLCLVEDGVYRGAHPSLKNMRFMRRLKLRTILSLIPESIGPSRDLREYCDNEHIRHIWHQVNKYDDGFSHTPQLVASILSELVDPRNHPLFLHCRDGSHNTGLVVMCLRRLQNWSLPTIYEEFVRYTKSNAILFEEKQFVESFHATVCIPITIPAWLWQGVRHATHPSIQLELEKDPDNLTPAATLRIPNTPEGREAELLGGLASPHVERQDSSGPVRRKGEYKQIQMHYNENLAALDLAGLHFVSCCAPHADGKGWPQ